MISQVEGMAKALNVEFSHKIVRLSFPWNMLPPKLTPISSIILKDKSYLSNNENIDLIISCGRKSVVPSILFKKKNKKIFTIHIQNPKVNFKNFDAIIAPEHDKLKGENIYSSKGAIHYITLSEIKDAQNYLKSKVSDKKIVSLILGGPNKYYSFNNEELLKIFNEIKLKFISKGYQVIVIRSMRTSDTSIEFALKELGEYGHVVTSVDKQAYLSALALANNIIVTCDSTSMISESATSGKPIYVAHMKTKKNNYRFKRFFKLFKDLGITRDLGEAVESWTYNQINETERIANIINSKLRS
jgi:mitochondrial fission protein ELM1